MPSFLDRWRERRILKRHPIAEPDWRAVLGPIRAHPPPGRPRTRQGCGCWPHCCCRDKSLEPVAGPAAGLADAHLARRPRLPTHPSSSGCTGTKTGIRSWSIPIPSCRKRQRVDEAGVVHRHHTPLHGEAWEQGPVILAWEAVSPCGRRPQCGDPRDGSQAGHAETARPMAFPPLHKRMDRRAWAQVLGGAYRQLEQRVQEGYPPPLDPYGLESPGEFFAVASETFFEATPAPAQLLTGAVSTAQPLLQAETARRIAQSCRKLEAIGMRTARDSRQ